MMSNQKEMDDKCLVSVLCSTYNHAPYIRQCLDGFIMQKTNFRFQVIVHDDASTDGTQDIIKEYELKYPEIIKPIYQKTNGYGSERNRRDKFNAIKGKYLAFCEGDDYWIDSLKLQKQVDFLEKNEDYGFIHTDYGIINESKVKEYRINKCIDGNGFVLNSILLGKYGIGNLTVLFRRSLYDEIPNYYLSQNFLMGDLPLWIEFATRTKFKYLKDITACYRRLDNSASHSMDFSKRLNFYNSDVECRLFYIKKFHINIPDSKIRADKYILALKLCSQIGDKRKAFFYLWQLMKKYPSKITFKAILFFFIAQFHFVHRILVYMFGYLRYNAYLL